MRIAHCSYEIQGVRGGGIGTYVGEAGRALRAAGHETWLFTRSLDEAQRARLNDLDAFEHVVEIDRAAAAERGMRYATIDHARSASAACHRALSEAGVGFDWIEFPDYEGWGRVAFAERRMFGAYDDAVLAVHLHSPLHECLQYNRQAHNTNTTERLLAGYEDAAIRTAPLRLCPSLRLREMLAERLELGESEDAAEILRYPMTLEGPEWAAPTPPDPGAGRPLRIAYYGRLEPRKGVDQLVEAFARMPDLQLELIGADQPSSPWRTSLQDWLMRKPLPNVTFRGALPRDELLAELSRIDVCIFPSTWENWPNACLEAMAKARVVVGARNGGMSEMIEEGRSGFLVDGSDTADIVRVFRDEVLPARTRFPEIGAAAAERARAITSPSAYVERIEELRERHRRTDGSRVSSDATPHRIGVVIPAFGCEPSDLSETLTSVVEQARKFDAVVVTVADASVEANVRATCPDARVVTRPLAGPAEARNLGVAEIDTDYVVILEPGRRAEPEYASWAEQVLQRRGDADAIVGISDLVHGERSRSRRFDPQPFQTALGLVCNPQGASGALFRREMFGDGKLSYSDALGPYLDWGLWRDLARRGATVEELPRVWLTDRIRAPGIDWKRHDLLLGLLASEHPVPQEMAGDLAIAMLHGRGLRGAWTALRGHPEFRDDWRSVRDDLLLGVARPDAALLLHALARRIPLFRQCILPALIRLQRL